MLEISEATVYRIPDRFVLHGLDGETYWAFDVKNGDYFELNSTSYSILSCFDGKTPLYEIHGRIILKYPAVDPLELESDFKQLVDKMVKEGVLEPV